MGFETLTFAPIDRNLVEPSLLLQHERDWWNAYHASTYALLAPQLSSDDIAWLEAVCAPL